MTQSHRQSRFPVIIPAILLGALALCAVRPLRAQDERSVRQGFQNPGKQYRPMVRWWWPGDDVTDQEIDREIGILDASGFGGAEIQPFVTFNTHELPKAEAARVESYATPEFFHHVRAAADAAKAHGMWIDYTFGSGWPFGGGMAITPELSAIELRFTDNTVTGPESAPVQLKIPQWQPGLTAAMMMQAGQKPQWPAGWQERFEARSKIISVVAMRAASTQPAGEGKPELLDRSSAVVLTDRMRPDGTLDWQVPAGQWHIFVFRQFPTRQSVIGAAGSGPQLVLDHLDKAAFEAHAHRVGDPLASALGPDMGTSLRAIFCDSLEVQEYLFWTDDFLQQFRKRRGYDLTPYLAVLRQPGYNDFYFSHPGGLPLYNVAGGDAIRADYWKTVSELIYERFYHPFDEWAKEHHVESRVQAHGAPGDLLRIYGDASIPETEELDGGNTVNFMKLASSAGYDYGRRLVSSESFDFRGNPYITTPESIKANSDKLFISGVNEIVYHGFPYKFDDGPKGVGWFPFQGQFSSQINEANPIWPFIPKVNTYITRMQYILQRGTSHLQIALYRSSLNEDDTGPSLASGAVKDPLPAMEKELTRAGYSWGFVNERVLLHSTMKHGQLWTKGGGGYRAIVIPAEMRVSPATVRALEMFAAAKLPIVFAGGMPQPDVSFKGLKQNLEEVATGLDRLQHSASVSRVASESEAAARLAPAIRPQLRFASGTVLPFVKKTIGATQFYFLRNPDDKATETTVEFPETAVPQEWDPWTGKVHSVAFEQKGGGVVIDFALPPYGSALIAFNKAIRAGSTPAPWTETKRQAVGDGGWEIDAVGDSAQGVGTRLHLRMTQLTDWLNEPALRTFSGRATYTTYVTATAADLEHAGRVLLDLGQVKDAAAVRVNGAPAGSLVVQPFAVDVRPFLHAGRNEIQITVVNSLTNYVSTIAWPKIPGDYRQHYPPISAGLMGPVSLEYETAGRSR